MKLPKHMSKYADRIADIRKEGDDGYWVDYKPGWRSYMNESHMEHEESKRELWLSVRMSEPCHCEECKSHMGERAHA